MRTWCLRKECNLQAPSTENNNIFSTRCIQCYKLSRS